jgi:hypothetical protein
MTYDVGRPCVVDSKSIVFLMLMIFNSSFGFEMYSNLIIWMSFISPFLGQFLPLLGPVFFYFEEIS